jgi:PaREP1/PaREP8 domain containing family protein
VRKRDAVQASEKDYRAAEEVVKALAEGLDVPEHGHAMAEEAVGRSWAASGLAC